jgi:hypothetical protein
MPPLHSLRNEGAPMTTKKPAGEPSVQKVQGPASYFPSIERTYGQPVDHWFAILANAGDKKHMELVVSGLIT